jgi:hypothetical protein
VANDQNQVALSQSHTPPVIPEELWGFWRSDGRWQHPCDIFQSDERSIEVYPIEQDAKDRADAFNKYSKLGDVCVVAARIK